ncbi:hypothetical protein TNCV_1289931 [Trichonephila clavipes]|nr:hypothetical protein TNCV_1289931 [Trichonephila clavipes]
MHPKENKPIKVATKGLQRCTKPEDITINLEELGYTVTSSELRRLEQAESEASHRAAETPEQSQARHRRHAEYLAAQRAAETPEQSQARRLQHAAYMASQRDTETIEAAESSKRAVAERAQQRRLIFTRNTWGVIRYSCI